MSRIVVPLLLLAISYAGFFGYVVSSYDELPLKVASHFDLYGHANGWMSREALVYFTVGLAVFLPAVVIGTMASVGQIPVSFVNLPHRDYWMAPERRQETKRILLPYSLWFSSLNVLFITGVHCLIVRANAAGGPPRLDSKLLALIAGAFLLGTILWIYLLVRRFSKMP